MVLRKINMDDFDMVEHVGRQELVTNDCYHIMFLTVNYPTGHNSSSFQPIVRRKTLSRLLGLKCFLRSYLVI